jgi:hypothetical protein
MSRILTLTVIAALLLPPAVTAIGNDEPVAKAADRSQAEPVRHLLRDPDYIDPTTADVLRRCGLSPNQDLDYAPWYFFYELGLELDRQGDARAALDAFLEATERRPEPGHDVRLYGMWFLDYLPYFRIATIQAELGHWQCAADAAAESERLGEIRKGDRDEKAFKLLKSELLESTLPKAADPPASSPPL